MKKKIFRSFTLFTFFFSSTFAKALPLVLGKEILDGSQVSFIPHTKPKKFGSYLSMNLLFEPVHALKKELETKLKLKIQTRGEAHITVLTPPEFEKIQEKLSIHQITDLFRQSIQSSHFEISCLGRGQANLNGVIESTFFIVVKSEDLLQTRRLIHKKFLELGGDEEVFKPEEFYPHITVGYTKRDLHLSDGVKKDDSSCFLPLVTHPREKL